VPAPFLLQRSSVDLNYSSERLDLALTMVLTETTHHSSRHNRDCTAGT
jgi:hypothetical protein